MDDIFELLDVTDEYDWNSVALHRTLEGAQRNPVITHAADAQWRGNTYVDVGGRTATQWSWTDRRTHEKWRIVKRELLA